MTMLGIRGGCVRRANSSRHRAPRRLLTPTAWSVVRLGAGVRRPPARGGVPFTRRLRFAHVVHLVSHVPYLPRDPHSPRVPTVAPAPPLPCLPHSSSVPPLDPRLQALASDFLPVPGRETARTGANSDRKRVNPPTWGLHLPGVGFVASGQNATPGADRICQRSDI